MKRRALRDEPLIFERNPGRVRRQGLLLPEMDVTENVMLPAYPLGVPYSVLTQKAQALLERFGGVEPVELVIGNTVGHTAIKKNNLIPFECGFNPYFFHQNMALKGPFIGFYFR